MGRGHPSTEPTPGSSPWQGTGCPTGWESISNRTNEALRLQEAADKKSSQSAAGDWGIFLGKKKSKTKTCSPKRRIQNLPQGPDELQRAVPGESTAGHVSILVKK